jgi:hypothetical protein
MHSTDKPTPRMSDTKPSLRHYIDLGPVFGYFFRKPDPNAKPNFNLRSMHIINKISMGMFLVGLIMFIIKLALR